MSEPTKETGNIDHLLNIENNQLKKFQKMVADSLAEQDLIIDKLTQPDLEKMTFGDRLADKVAIFGGSWKFIIIFSIILVVWIVLNTAILSTKAFDPYPFILMNLILSSIAALQAPIIMMSQNRQETKDRKRAENDYVINLKAEIEIRELHTKLNLLMEDQIKNLFEIQKVQIDLLKELKDNITAEGKK